MTRLGPLTSQALGRSPYDIVVQGEGEANPRAPRQQYDERGRPVNAETKRINRDIVRSHNEVMQVIGVAEPETGNMSAEAEANRRLLQQHYEDHMGKTFWSALRIAGTVGIWGTDPLRQRALLYRRYDDFLPWRHFRQNYGAQALFTTFVTGLPMTVAERLLVRNWIDQGGNFRSRWLYSVYAFVRTHLQAYVCLQRLSIVPRHQWCPSPLFFVPFSSESPISLPPPLPAALTWSSVLQWTGQAFLSLAPIAMMYAYTEIYDRVYHRLNHAIFNSMDTPSNPPLRRPVWLYSPFTSERQLAGVPPAEHPYPPPGPRLRTLREMEQEREQEREQELEQEREREQEREQRPSVSPPHVENERLFSDPDDSQRNAMEVQAAEVALEALTSIVPSSTAMGPDGHELDEEQERAHEQQQQQFRSGTPAPGSPAPARRRNTVSSGGGDDGYISEEEEFELSATLISFDVEAAEAGDQPPNAWSAELRQSSSAAGYDGSNSGGPYGGARANGTYIRGVYYPDANVSFMSDTMLSRLPATVYSACTAALLTKLGMIDLEALVIRTLAWTYRRRSGLPVGDLRQLVWVPFLTVGLSASAVNHVLMSVVFQSLFDAALLTTAIGLGYVYHGSRPPSKRPAGR